MCGDLYSVPPGRHVVEVQSHILGEAEEPEPVQLMIDTRCPEDVRREVGSATSVADDVDALGDVSPDGVNPIANLEGAGEGNVANVEGGSSGPGSSGSGSRASGCAFRPSSIGSGAGVLGLLLVLARRRRSSR